MKFTINPVAFNVIVANAVKIAVKLNLLTRELEFPVLLKVHEGIVYVSAINDEVMAKWQLATSGDCENGEFAVNGKMLKEAIASMAKSDMVTIADEGDKLLIKEGRNKLRIALTSIYDMPVFNLSSLLEEIPLDKEVWRLLPALVAPFVASEDNRPMLTNISFNTFQVVEKQVFNDDTQENETVTTYHIPRIAAADGYRLSILETPDYTGKNNFLLPVNALNPIIKCLDHENVKMELYPNALVVTTDQATVIARLSDGTFPAVEQIIPKTSDKVLRTSAAMLYRAAKRAAVYAKDSSGKLKLIFCPANEQGQGTFKTFAQSIERGDCETDLDFTGELAEEFGISFDCNYLIEALSAVGDQEVTLSMNANDSPLLITVDDMPNFRHVLMPLHENRR